MIFKNMKPEKGLACSTIWSICLYLSYIWSIWLYVSVVFVAFVGWKHPPTISLNIHGHRNWEDVIWTPKTYLKHWTSEGMTGCYRGSVSIKRYDLNGTHPKVELVTTTSRSGWTEHEKQQESNRYKGGSVPVINRLITSLLGVISPQLPIYNADYKAYISIYNC